MVCRHNVLTRAWRGTAVAWFRLELEKLGTAQVLSSPRRGLRLALPAVKLPGSTGDDVQKMRIGLRVNRSVRWPTERKSSAQKLSHTILYLGLYSQNPGSNHLIQHGNSR